MSHNVSHISNKVASDVTFDTNFDATIGESWHGVLSARGQSQACEETLRPIIRLGTMTVADTRRSVASSGQQDAPSAEDAFDVAAIKAPLLRKRYQAHRLIGYGGMAWVYRASQLALNRRVAIKMLNPASGSHNRELFAAESRTLACLEHPNIIPVYDAGDGWLAMKEIVGHSLESQLQAVEPLCQDELTRFIDYLTKVVDAISFAHKQGVVHRDIKAHNVMLGSHGEVLVVDWGIAVSVHRDEHGHLIAPAAQSADGRLGTPACMPPEVARGDRHAIQKSLDIYLLGALLYRIIGGRMPFAADDSFTAIQSAARNEYPRLQCRGQHYVSPRLVHLAEQAMADNPQDRPSADDFASQLRDWLRFSMLEDRALSSLKNARRFLKQAQSLDRRQWDEAYILYNRSVAEYENCRALMPEMEGLAEELHAAFHAYAMAALAVGNIFLARMLVGGHRPPLMAAGIGVEEASA